jgi:hypothetical protein
MSTRTPNPAPRDDLGRLVVGVGSIVAGESYVVGDPRQLAVDRDVQDLAAPVTIRQ